MDPQLWEEVARGAADEEIEALVRLRRNAEPPGQIRIVTRFGPIATCRLKRSDILTVRRHPAVLSLKAARRLTHDLPQLLPMRIRPPRRLQRRRPRPARRPRVPQTGEGVVLGIIDYGCDVAHRAFRNADGGSRVEYLWDQGGEPGPAGPPQPYAKGRVYDRAEINRALESDDPYAAMGYHPAPSSRPESGSHGTHVMDIAAGNGRGQGPTGMAPAASLIFVHVAAGNTSGLRNFGDSVGILEAVDFILDRAGDRPCVINISMGRHGGPHDGSTLIELAIDYLLRARQSVAVVQSAGNYFDRDIHAGGQLSEGGTDQMGWFVPDTDTTTNELEIWYSRGDRITVSIESPDNGVRVSLRPGDRKKIVIGGDIVGRAYHRIGDPNNGDNQVDIFIYGDAPRGTWQIGVQGTRVQNGRWHAWIERDGSSETQSYFTEGPVSRAMTCGTIAHGRLPIQVAAHSGRGWRQIAPFSSAGPTRDGRHVPVVAAPGVRIPAARSAVPGRSNSHREVTRKSGTSMAAPHVAGLLVLMLEAAPRANARDLRRILRDTARPVRTSRNRAHLRSAWGAVDARAAVRRAAGLPNRGSVAGRNVGDEIEEIGPTVAEWQLIANWLRAGYVPTDGRGRLPTNQTLLASRPLPSNPVEAARYLARALLNNRRVRLGAAPRAFPNQSRVGGSPLDPLAVQLVAAAAPSRAEWRELAQFMERQTTANRDGTAARRLFDGNDAANRITMAHHLACRRLQTFPNRRQSHLYCTHPMTSPVDPPIRILARKLQIAGQLVDWTMVPANRRRAYIMDRLVRVFGYPINSAAGIVGNLDSESGLLPERVEGSARTMPRTSRPRGGGAARRHSAAEIMNRSLRLPRGPERPGVGLAQWTTAGRRRSFFAHRYGPIEPGAGILFFMDAQIDFLVRELRANFGTLDRRLRRVTATLNDAADDFVYDFERPGAILEPDPASPGRQRRRARADAQVQRVFRARRANSRAALQAYNVARRTKSYRTVAAAGQQLPDLAGNFILLQESADDSGRTMKTGARVLPGTVRHGPAGILVDVVAAKGLHRRLISDSFGRLRPGLKLIHKGESA